MTVANRHIIRKQIIELELPKKQGTWQLQQTTSQLFQEKVIPQLDAIFDDLNLDKQRIAIPYLEVDLGIISPAQFKRVFVEKCVYEVQKNLTKEVEKLKKEGPNTIRPTPQTMETFFFFLENGLLPWSANFRSIADLEKAMLEIIEGKKNSIPTQLKTSIQQKATVLAQLKTFLQQKPSVLTRLTKQFSFSFLKEILISIFTVSAQQLEFHQKEIAILLKQPLSLKEERLLYLALFKQLFKGNFSENKVASISHQLKQSLHRPLNEIEEKRLQKLIRQQFFKATDLTIFTLIERFLESTAHPEKVKEIKQNTISPLAEPHFKAVDQNIGLLTTGWYIENAGLVICALFLKPLFVGFELLEADKFKDATAQNKALLLSQYLVTGVEAPAEFLLSLNKLLCGVPVQAPVERMVSLTTKDKEEVENLLNHLIQHWTILGDTSIEALRNTFLKRKGKLTYEKHRSSWLLQIEKKGFDICVEKLPWAISVIKLPWMEETLYVDWV